ncbi:MAG: extracellular solute-binding protein [Polyangia bacterium]
MHALSLLLLTKVAVWHAYSGGEERALQQVVHEYNSSQAAEHGERGVQVEAIAVPYGSLADKLQAAIPRGHGPDAFLFAHDLLGQWTRLGLLQRIDPLLGADLDAVRAGLLPQTLKPLQEPQQGVGDGEALWGLPLSFKSLALFYRRDLVERPPETTDELLRLCRKLREESPPNTRRYGLAYEAGTFFRHAVWLHGFGGSIIAPGPPGPDGKPGPPLPRLDTPEELRALEFLAGLARRGDIPDEMTSVLVTQFFNQGRAALTINGPWFLSEIEPGVPYGVAPLPVVSETGRKAAPLTSIEAGFVSRNTPHPREAADFLRYLAGPKGALPRLVLGRQSVSDRATWQHPEAQKDPVLRAFYAQLEHAVPSPSHPAMRSFWEPGEQALRQVLRGGPPEPALRSAQRLLDQYLAPPLPTADEGPYLVLLSLGLLALAAWAVRRTVKEDLVRKAWRGRGGYPYLVPAALAMTLLVLVPFLVGAGMSLFTRDLDGGWRFVGAANFRAILLCEGGSCLQPMSFYFTLLVTLVWTVVNVALHVLIGGGLALLLRDPLLKLRGVYRMLLIVPWAVPNYITALIWKGMFNRQFGAVNGLLALLSIPPVAWFSGFFTALCANIATNVWLGFPFMMVVALGSLAQIPAEVEEAAQLDGATRWQRLRHILLPLLLPSMLPAIVLGAIWTFNMFNVVFLVSGGEPDGATDILVSQAYRWAFSRGHRYGYAAAYAVLIFLILLGQTALSRRLTDRRGGSSDSNG